MMIPETGAGVPGANSYSTVAQADAFHEIRANEAWSDATEASKIAALVRATDYIEATYRASGDRLTAAQGLQWPVDGSEAVPTCVISATHALALYSLAGPLSGPASRGIKSTKESLDGVASEEITYDDLAPVDPYPFVTFILSGTALVRGASSGAMRIVRLVR